MTTSELISTGLRELATPTNHDVAHSTTSLCSAIARWREDPQERLRITDLSELLDLEDSLYEEAIAALEEGDLHRAERLLRQCAEQGIGDAEELLNDLLQRTAFEAEQEAIIVEQDPGSRFETSVSPLFACHAKHSVSHGDARSSRIRQELAALLDAVVFDHSSWKDQGLAAARRRELLKDFALLYTRDRQGRSHTYSFTATLPARLIENMCAQHSAPLAGYRLFGIVVSSIAPGARVDLPRPQTLAWFSEALSALIRSELAPLAWSDIRLREPEVAAEVLLDGPMRHLRPTHPIGKVVNYLLRTGQDSLPVVQGGRVVGTAALRDLAAGLRPEHAHEPVTSVMRPAVFVRMDTPIDEIREVLRTGSADLLSATDRHGRVRGYITPKTALPRPTITHPIALPSLSTITEGELNRRLLVS